MRALLKKLYVIEGRGANTVQHNMEKEMNIFFSLKGPFRPSKKVKNALLSIYQKIHLCI